MAIVYIILLVIVLVLLVLSRNIELPPGIQDTGVSRAFLRVSLFIYQQFGGGRSSFSRERIRIYLGTLQQKKDMESVEIEYFIRKISIVLMMATAGSFLSLMMCLSSIGSTSRIDEGTVVRNPFGEKAYDLDLVASDAVGEEIGEYELSVNTRRFTDSEAQALFTEASELLEKAILKENESLDHVTSDLDLVEKLDGYPFDIRWRVDDFDVMHFDGKLNEENIPDEGVNVMLTATFSYGENRWQQIMYASVYPKELTVAQRTVRDIGRMLKTADEESSEKEMIVLPESYKGRDVVWTEKKSDNSMLILILTLIGGAASFVLKDKELKKSIEERELELLSDYPKLVSKLVLYMGAGMTVRNIFWKLSASYLKELEAGGKRRYLSEEMLRATRELMAGASESEVYERFGERCGVREYTRLTTLLVQNLKKGNSELLSLLQEESKRAFEERMDRVRKIGEEAGTKLLMPMIIMLVIVMAMIMIPAYMAF
jgi:hypothetical protein